MAALEDVLRRVHTDDAYRDAVARDPTICLREFALGPDEMAVVEEAVRGDGSAWEDRRMDHHLAQANVARFLAPPGDPLLADFMAGLDPVNAIADTAPGFVWRLQTDEGNATSLRPDPTDERLLINMSVWTSVEALADFVYRQTDHVAFLRRRREWFSRMTSHHQALWWVPAGTVPTVPEAMARVAHLDAHGPTPEAFTFARRFGPPGSSTAVEADARDVCEV